MKYVTSKSLRLTAKYSFSILITLLTLQTTGDIKYIFSGFLELLIIAFISNLVLKKNSKIGLVCNNLLTLLYNAQMFVLFFGNSYISVVMLDNLHSVEALGGKTLEYGLAIVLTIIFSCIPIREIKFPLKLQYGTVTSAILMAVTLYGIAGMGGYSPNGAYINLAIQEYKIFEQRQQIEQLGDVAQEFYREEVEDYRKKDDALEDRPNVILIFTEGLSQHIISDERDIMPNVAAWQKKSLNFTGYYNHTFATYRGLIGQLYSGHQYDDLDTNSLIGIQDILKDYGYNTVFINTEPSNSDFTNYLNSFGYDEIIGEAMREYSGNDNSLSDKEAYTILYEICKEKNTSDTPFFVTMYTFGTHISFDSIDKKFGDGTDNVLNRFYDLDYQFSIFMDKFQNSSLSDNTIVIFTADHASYVDSDYIESFSAHGREVNALDEIPLWIYYKGINPETIDSQGQNSLNLAPTILDYLDMSGENYFLGDSLFKNLNNDLNKNIFDTVFWYKGMEYYTTAGSKISLLSDDKKDIFLEQIEKYFASNNLKNNFSSYSEGCSLTVNIDEEFARANILFESDIEQANIWFAIWSIDDGQDDLQWYEAEKIDNKWKYSVDLNKHNSAGEYILHVYQGIETPEKVLMNQGSFFV